MPSLGSCMADVRLSVPRLLMGDDVFGDIHITKIEMGRRTDSRGMSSLWLWRSARGGGRSNEPIALIQMLGYPSNVPPLVLQLPNNYIWRTLTILGYIHA